MQISWHDSCTSTISIDFTMVAKSPPVRDYYILISFSGSKKRGFKPFIGRHSRGRLGDDIDCRIGFQARVIFRMCNFP